MKSNNAIKTAIVGCGAISKKYMHNLQNNFSVIDLVGCTDVIKESAQKAAQDFGIKAMTMEEILQDEQIRIVLNLTPPPVHYEVSRTLLEAGKNVYTEKAITIDLGQANELIDLAKEKNVLFTAAPDTFLGGGWQTARKLIDDGFIGEPLTVHAVCTRAYQLTQPNPGLMYLFREGGGMPFDMSGYYLHSMINLVGPLKRVGGFMKTRNQERPFLNPANPDYKKTCKIEAKNMMTCSLEFESGVYGSLMFTSESNAWPKPTFEIHGTQGVLKLFDPDFFSGKLVLQRALHSESIVENSAEVELPFTHGFLGPNRGIGAADMAYAIINGRKPRADASMARHALEAIVGVRQSCETDTIYTLKSTCGRPAAIRQGVFGFDAQETVLDD